MSTLLSSHWLLLSEPRKRFLHNLHNLMSFALEELVNTEKQIHMVNGALNVLDLLINDNKDEE